MKHHTLRKKYFSKLLTRIVQLFSTIVLMGLVPRVLGPTNLGVYDFLNSFFGNVNRFVKLETSQAFFTKLSKRQTEFRLIGFIIIYNLIALIITALFLFILFTFGFKDRVFGDISLVFIMLSMIFTFLLSYVDFLRLTHDVLDQQ